MPSTEIRNNSPESNHRSHATGDRFSARKTQQPGHDAKNDDGVAASGLDFQETLEFLFRSLRDEHTTRAAADRILQQLEEETAAKQRRNQLFQQYPANSECPNCGFIKPAPGAKEATEA